MTKELMDEMRDIARQLEEQLKFYREIGVRDLGGAAKPTQRAEPKAASSPDQEPRSQQQEEDAMPRKKAPAPPEQTGLFGDVESTPPPATPTVLEPQDASLEAIREDIGECVRCKLHQHRTHIVFGEGDPKARIVFVGEGPGADEDATGRPFVGKAGQLLDKIIAAIGLRREDVYIANIVKCRPPGNRTPERDEVATCEQFLFRQLAFINPKVIVALGSPAFQTILRTKDAITRARGQWREWNGVKVMPTFHPAYLLRVPEKKREAWEDMKKVRDYLNSLPG